MPFDLRAAGSLEAVPAPVAALDRHLLYEATQQSPRHVVPLLRALHGGTARVLGEDFCGTGQVASAWTLEVPGGEAQALDLDPQALARVRAAPELTVMCADLRAQLPRPLPPVDVIYAGSFSIGYLHARGELLAYLRRSRARLEPGGILVCDTFGGAAAWRTGAIVREHFLPGSLRVRATWEQRAADVRTGLVENALHFRVDREGDVAFQQRDAFVYRWRVWSLPELADALRETGYRTTRFFAHLDVSEESRAGVPRPIENPAELGDPGERWAVLVAAQA